MKQVEDTKTIDLLGEPPKGRGRPRKSDAMSSAQRMALHRARLRAEGLVDVNVKLPREVVAALDAFIQFRDTNKDAVIEKLVRSQIMRKR